MPEGTNRIGNSSAARPVRIENGLCSRHRCSRSACQACQAVCSVPEAILLAAEGVEVTESCVGCGACVSACPNGAIRAREEDRQVAETIRKRADAGQPFRISCSRAKGRADLVVSCLGRLTEALLLEPIRAGATRTEVLDPGCAGCGLAKAAPQWTRTLDWALALAEAAGAGTGRVRLIDGTKSEPGKGKSVSGASRRGLFRALAAGLAEPRPVPEAPAAEPFRVEVRRHHDNPKRTHLLEVLADLAGKDRPPVSGVASAGLRIDAGCTGCNVCETLCPVGALSHREENGFYSLAVVPALCTGCGVCRDACYHGVVHVVEGVDPPALLERRPVVLVSAVRRSCPTCRETYLGEDLGACPLCRTNGQRRQAMARRFLSGGNRVHRP